MSRFNIPGLLGAIGELPSVINRGLLGPMNVNPQLGLDPTQVQQAQDQSLNDFAFGMLAGNRRAPGASLYAARQQAREGFSGRVFDMLKEQELIRLNKQRAQQDQDDATMRAQLAEYRRQNPDKANLPDAVLLQYMNPQTEIATSNLALDQQRLAQSMIEADANRALQERQLQQQQANADRSYELQRLQMQADEQKFRATLRAAEGKVDPTEARQRRDSARASSTMVGLLDRLHAEVSEKGTELFGQNAGVQGNLYGQILSEYKQAKQLGTLDKGLLDLFDKMLLDPTSGWAAANPWAKSKILKQIETLREETEKQYGSDYEYLKSNGLDDGLAPLTPAIGSSAFLKQLEEEGKKRKLW